MRSFSSRAGTLLTAAVVCLSLAGCASSMFGDTVEWEGGTLYNDKLLKKEKPEYPMSLRLKADGTGIGRSIPTGVPPMDDNVCIAATDDRYTGVVKWRRHSDSSFEIEFADSKYLVVSGKRKFAPDWTEARIYTCTWGLEYWRMPLRCANPGVVKMEKPTCGIAFEDPGDRGRRSRL